MKSTYYQLTIGLFFICQLLPINTFAQSITADTLAWHLDESLNEQNHDTVTYVGIFKTVGTQEIHWIQQNGQRTSIYTVQSTEGAWNDVTTNGTFTYHLIRDGKTCTLSFEKGTQGMFARMAFPQTIGTGSLTIRFHVTSVQPQP